MGKKTTVQELYSEYLDFMVQDDNNPKTVREHRRFLEGPIKAAVGNIEIESLRIVDVARIKQAAKDRGAHGPERALVTFRQLTKFARGQGFNLLFDWRDIELPKLAKKLNEYLTPEEIDKIRNALDTTTHAGLRHRALLETLLDTGMRIGEACVLKKEDIDWQLQEAIIKNVKTDEMQKVFFTDRSLEWIKRYIDSRKDDMPWVFISGRGHLLETTSRNYMRTHLKNLGIKKHIKHHIFRKTFATVLIQGGADITAVGDLCRHRSPRTTLEYYAAVNKERSKDIHRKVMNKMLNGRLTPDEYFGDAEAEKEKEKAKKRII
jgi:integrase/recombinase XerD